VSNYHPKEFGPSQGFGKATAPRPYCNYSTSEGFGKGIAPQARIWQEDYATNGGFAEVLRHTW